jgi:hypothetical protein
VTNVTSVTKKNVANPKILKNSSGFLVVRLYEAGVKPLLIKEFRILTWLAIRLILFCLVILSPLANSVGHRQYGYKSVME